MKAFYNVTIQMRGTYEAEAVMEKASHFLHFGKRDIEECNTHNVNIMYSSDVKPTEMRDRVRWLLTDAPTIHYVDVIYRFEYEMVPDRFVIWQDGSIKEYTGHVEFREDD